MKYSDLRVSHGNFPGSAWAEGSFRFCFLGSPFIHMTNYKDSVNSPFLAVISSRHLYFRWIWLFVKNKLKSVFFSLSERWAAGICEMKKGRNEVEKNESRNNENDPQRKRHSVFQRNKKHIQRKMAIHRKEINGPSADFPYTSAK